MKKSHASDKLIKGEIGSFHKRYFSNMTSLYIALPKIALVLLLLQGLSISLIGDLSVQGLTPPRWQIADILEKYISPQHQNDPYIVLNPYPNTVYQLLGFISDIKQLVPFFAVIFWAYFSRRYFKKSINIIPLHLLRLVVYVHLSIAILILMGLIYFIYSNGNGNIVGETRFGFLSVWNWLREEATQRPSILSIIMIFIYRGTYISLIFISCFASSFPAITLIFSITATQYSQNESKRKSINSLLPQAIIKRLGPGIRGRENQRWLLEYFKLLFGLLAFVACSYALLWEHGHYAGSQFLKVALPILLIVSAFVIIPLLLILLNKQQAIFGNLVYWIYFAVLAMTPFFADIAFEKSAQVIYIAKNHDRQDVRDRKSLEYVGKVCTSIASSHFESAFALDATRVFWESLRLKGLKPIDCNYILYITWSARLTKLEHICNVNRASFAQGLLDSLIILPQRSLKETTYAWESTSNKCGTMRRRWSSRILRHAQIVASTVDSLFDNQKDALLTPHPVANKSTGETLSIREFEDIIWEYLNNEIYPFEEGNSEVKETIAYTIKKYLHSLDIDKIARSNYRYIAGNCD